MPEKEKTERQFARLIGSTPLQVKLTLVKITNHKPKNRKQLDQLCAMTEIQLCSTVVYRKTNDFGADTYPETILGEMKAMFH